MEQQLHSKQRELLGCIRKYYGNFGISPTVRDLSEMTKITLSVVYYHLDRLVELGYIKRNKHKARGLVLLEQEEEMSHDKIPLLGNIAAGLPLPNPVGPPHEYIHVATTLLPDHYEGLYALRVQGDSMIDALVHDGDYVILHYQETANPGDMVAAWIATKEEAALKYYHPDGSKVTLVSDNIENKPIVVDPSDLEIKGVVVFVMRSFKNRRGKRMPEN